MADQTADAAAPQDHRASSPSTELKAKTLSVRREGLTRFIDRAPALLAALESAGLKGTAGLTPEAVETILIEDPFWCELCDGTPAAAERMCPATKRPHRRFLVLVAEALLKLVGEARAGVVPADTTRKLADKQHRAEPSSPTQQLAPGGDWVVRRGVPVNPQLMLLAFHSAGRADAEIDSVHRELAAHLVQSLELLKAALTPTAGAEAAGRTSVSPAQRQHIGRLVFSFARAWREYLRVATTIARASTHGGAADHEGGQINSPTTPMTPFGAHAKGLGGQTTTAENAGKELVRSAADTYCALSDLKAQLRSRAGTEDAVQQIDRQMDAVERRIDRIGGAGALAELHRRVQAAPAPSRSSASASPAAASPATGTESDRFEAKRPSPIALTSAAEESDDPAAASDVPAVVPSGGMTPHARPSYRPRRAVSRHLPAATSASESEFVQAEADEDDASASTSTAGVSSVEAAKFAIKRTTPMGPALPPNWSVGRDGKSHPPAKPSAEQLASEKKAQAHFKAQAAYKARLNLQQASAQQPSAEQQASRNVVSMVEDSMWVAFRSELMQDPPNLSRVPQLLKVVGEGLAEALPKRVRARVEQDILDALDWDAVKRKQTSSVHDTRAVADMLQFVVDRIGDFGAPAKAAEVAAAAEKVKAELLEAGRGGKRERVADATVATVRFMFKSVRELHEDIAKFGMAFINPELAQMAVEAAKAFQRDWMAPPERWETSKRWIRDAAMAANRAGHISYRPSQPLTPEHMRLTVALGILSICASAKKPSEHRWDGFPTEALFFERPVVFATANTLQFCTLRLMITNTVTLLVSQPAKKLQVAGQPPKPRLPPPEAKKLVKKLDAHLRVWLGMAPAEAEKGEASVLNLNKLKEEVAADVNHALLDYYADAIDKRTAQVGDVVLADSETRVLHNVLDKVSKTDSHEYVAFEGRVVAAVTTALKDAIAPAAPDSSDVDSDDDGAARRPSPTAGGPKRGPHESPSSTGTETPAPFERLGVVSKDLVDLVGDLVRTAELNVEVHGEAYAAMLAARA